MCVCVWGGQTILKDASRFFFFYPGGNASGAACRDSVCLERCVYDLCSNGILIDTMVADDTLCLPTDDASGNKQKTKQPAALYLTIAQHICIYIIPFSQVHSPTPLQLCSTPLQSQKYQPLININYWFKPITFQTHKAADPNKLSRVNSTWSLSGLTKWSN